MPQYNRDEIVEGNLNRANALVTDTAERLSLHLRILEESIKEWADHYDNPLSLVEDLQRIIRNRADVFTRPDDGEDAKPSMFGNWMHDWLWPAPVVEPIFDKYEEAVIAPAVLKRIIEPTRNVRWTFDTAGIPPGIATSWNRPECRVDAVSESAALHRATIEILRDESFEKPNIEFPLAYKHVRASIRLTWSEPIRYPASLMPGVIQRGFYTCNGSPTGCERERFGQCGYHDALTTRPRATSI